MFTAPENLDLRLAIEDALPVGDVAVKVRCITTEHGPKDKANSMAVYRDHLYCYGCGFTRKDADEALALLLKVTPEQARASMSRYTSDAIDGYRERAAIDARRDPLPKAHAALYNWMLMGDVFGNGALFPDRVQWLYDRGLTDETIGRSLLGHDGERFVIPIFDAEGKLLSLRYRADPERCSQQYLDNHKYMGLTGRNGRYLYPEPLIAADERDWICVNEGEFDSLVLWQDDIPAATLTNGAGQCRRLPAMLPERIKTVYICTDNDEAGNVAAEEVATECDKLGLAHKRVTWPEGKDISEAYLSGWRFEK